MLLSDVSLSIAYIGPNSRRERGLGRLWYGILEFNVPLDTV